MSKLNPAKSQDGVVITVSDCGTYEQVWLTETEARELRDAIDALID